MDLRRLLLSLYRHRWLIGGMVGVAMVCGAIASLVISPHARFVARATLMPSEHALTLGDMPGREGSSRETRLANLRELATCRAVAERAAGMLGRGASPVALQRGTFVTTPRHEQWQSGSDMLYLQVDGANAQQAVRNARAVATAFVSFYEELAKSGASATRRFLEQEALAAKSDLDAKRAALVSFQRAYGLATTEPGVDANARRSEATDLRRQLDAAQAAYQENAAALAQAESDLRRQPATTRVETGSSDSPVTQQLQGQLAMLEAELASETAIHTAEHPRVVALGQQIDSMKRRLRQEQGRISTRTAVSPNPVYQQLQAEVMRLRSTRAALAGRMASLRSALGRRESLASRVGGTDVTLDTLTHQYKQAQQEYTSMVSRLNQARLDERVAASQAAINVVDLPTAAEPGTRQGRGPLQLVLAAAALSLFLGAVLAVVLDNLDVRLNHADDVMARMKLPVTATIPSLAGFEPRALPRASHVAPLSPHAEAYRFLRSELIFADPDRDIRAILVATPKPGQGGTITCTNLAISMAQAGRRVIVVDADLRRPSLHDVFATPLEPGLTDYLSGDVGLVEALKPTEMSNLLLLPAGRATEQPAELLGSEQMKLLVGELKRHADYVFFDSPAAVAFTDATLVASQVDGVLLVVRASVRFTGAEVTVRQRMEKAGANFVGVVLNDLPPTEVESYRYHTSYYGAEHALARRAALQPPAETGGTMDDLS